ncbi:MAG TPA: hypothetical protein VKA10_03310 [Prolixibacteraceae bacterium]|nr:hypothetical protein [Prolixibacteraceae bacterium]
MYNLEFNKKDNLLLVVVRGEVSVTEMIDYIKKLEQYRKYTNKLQILQDSREIITKLELFDIPVVADQFEKVLKKYQSIRHADVHHLPASTGYALIYQYQTKFPTYRYEIFNTIESAGKWLLRSIDNQSVHHFKEKF